MARTLEFFFDYGSPTTYLAHVQLPGLAARTGCEIVRRPMLLGAVFKVTGNQTPAAIPAKAKYYTLCDMPRMADYLGVPFTMNPYFIINTLPLMRGAVAALEDGYFEAYDAAMWRAMWVDGENLGKPEIIGKVLAGADLDPTAFAERTQAPAVKQSLIVSTEEAVNRGAFGAPTFFVGKEMFFGSDRMDYIERALGT